MQLSPNFSLRELTFSQTAQRHMINNTPNAAGIAKLMRVCTEILEPVRAHFGRPVSTNSGYRSPALNALIPGSSNTSQHTQCDAVDFEITGVAKGGVAKRIRDGDLGRDFGQLILEFYTPGQPSSGWVHCSLPSATNRNEVMTAIREVRNGRKRTRFVQGLQI